jgi:cell division protein FtsN
VIAQVVPKPVEPKPVKATEVVPKPAALTQPAPSPVALTPAPAAPEPSSPAAPAAALSEFVIVLPGFSSKDTAHAEIKALELLGFRTKDAQIEKDPRRGGYQITLAHMKSKGKADEMAASLQRMSFRAVVDLAQK